MRISIGSRTSTADIKGMNGYGYATKCMIKSLTSLGYHVSDNDSTADVEVWFDQPHHWKFSPGTYKIGYHPWESTLLLPGWADIMNECDEIWTPSPVIADWYRRYNNVKVPIYVYEHGVEHDWAPRERKVDDVMRFLHVGGETRKGGWDAMRLFRDVFTNKSDVEFTLKINNQSWLGIDRVGKLNIINKPLPFPDLQQLFYDSHVYVYPSWGEGFGLTPLQAMATGMPTICTAAWAPYRHYLDPDLKLSSELKTSTWEKIHPGKMFRPDFDDIADRMLYAYGNYNEVSEFAMSQTAEIHREYDWDSLTRATFESLEKRLQNSSH